MIQLFQLKSVGRIRCVQSAKPLTQACKSVIDCDRADFSDATAPLVF